MTEENHAPENGPFVHQTMISINAAEHVFNLCRVCFRGSLVKSMVVEAIQQDYMTDEEVNDLIQDLIDIRSQAPTIRMTKMLEDVDTSNRN